jgi:hypothetical protein
VPCPCGLKKIFRKLTLPPSSIDPRNPLLLTGTISGLSRYQALTEFPVAEIGIERSIGSFVSIKDLSDKENFMETKIRKLCGISYKQKKNFVFYTITLLYECN